MTGYICSGGVNDIMAEGRLKGKTIYILAWLILVCAGILIRTGTADELMQLIYDGIYGVKEGTAQTGSYGGSGARPDVYCYMNYWESQVQEVCQEGTRYSAPEETDHGKNAEQTAESGQEGAVSDAETGNQNEGAPVSKAEDSGKVTIPVMADITNSYIGMDSDTLLSYCYNVTYPKCVKSDELDAANLLGKDLTLDMDTGGYKVLIYHTHSSEAFADSRPGEVDDTVIGLGSRLAEILTDTYGIPVYHDTTSYDMMTGVLDRNASYDYSREGVSQILKDNPEIEVIIDLHRDGVPDDTHLVTDVDGKPTAQIMLLNGMCRDEEGNDVDYWSNDNKVDNMAFALQTYLAGRGNYGDVMRKIYISTSRYNMDLMPHAMLAEIGAQTNTVEEEYNAIEPFAAMLAKVLLK